MTSTTEPQDPEQPAKPGAVATWRSYVQGPRWARFDKTLRDRVWSDADLELVELEHDVGLLRATTRFEVRGSRAAMVTFREDILRGIESWNA